MNKKAVYGILLALILPLVCYFLIKGFTERAVNMPRHYIYDTVISQVKDGKEIADTVWHQVPHFNFTNQLGQPASSKEIEGKVWVASFFFTHCPSICPRLTTNMKMLQNSLHNNQKVGDRSPEYVQFLSFSVDPERDSVAALKKWADRFEVNPQNWWLLTGDKKAIYDLSLEHMKLGIIDGENVDSNFIHTERFVLIDRHRNIRGYYNGLDEASVAQLSRDIVFLALEKDKNRRSMFEGKLELIAVSFLLAIIGVGILIFLLKRKGK